MPTGPRMPPTPTPAQSQRTALRERVDSLTALTEQNANLRAELEALQFSNRVGALRVKVETIALKRGIDDGLDQARVGELAAHVDAAFSQHAENRELKLESFDVYSVIGSKLAELKSSVAPTAKNASPTSPLEALPPPVPQGRVAVNDTAGRQLAEQAQRDRGRQLAEQVLRDREAYRAALKKYGLSDPSTGNRGNASGTGFGL